MASYFQDPLSNSVIIRGLQSFADAMAPSRAPYWVAIFFLTLGFTFFYTLVIFQQQNLAENCRRTAGSSPASGRDSPPRNTSTA